MVANLDSYTLQARLLPCLLVILPLGLIVIALQPTQSWAFNLFSGVITTFGLTVLLAQLGRDLGKKRESHLFKEFGGVPTTLMLSHHKSKLDTETLRRYHRKLEKLIPSMRMPTSQEEGKSPQAAYQKYESCTRFLRERTRDKKKFHMVFAENVNYGYRRNLLGMKGAGVLMSVIGIAGCAFPLLYRTPLDVDHTILPLVCIFINISLFVWWVLRIRVRWVETVAWEYANQLLSACDSLEEESHR